GFDAFAEELCAFKEVRSLYLVSGAYDLAVFISAKTLNEVARFVSEKLSVVDGVISCSTHFILKKYKVQGQNTTTPVEREREILL
ncbi:MAG: Lrp/AsnC ligand binding domain-containing protein, partial [Clostridia bacterium]|nr:Lrp/AsnC ligand binding domain-containing protein [Clostridia bacterium]